MVMYRLTLLPEGMRLRVGWPYELAPKAIPLLENRLFRFGGE